jgi:hypothetical protein
LKDFNHHNFCCSYKGKYFTDSRQLLKLFFGKKAALGRGVETRTKPVDPKKGFALGISLKAFFFFYSKRLINN